MKRKHEEQTRIYVLGVIWTCLVVSFQSLSQDVLIKAALKSSRTRKQSII